MNIGFETGFKIKSDHIVKYDTNRAAQNHLGMFKRYTLSHLLDFLRTNVVQK